MALPENRRRRAASAFFLAIRMCQGGTPVADRFGDFVEGGRMIGSVAPYLMAAFGMTIAGLSALTLFYAIGHLDPPETPTASFDAKRAKS
jgi:hypothetical protein